MSNNQEEQHRSCPIQIQHREKAAWRQSSGPKGHLELTRRCSVLNGFSGVISRENSKDKKEVHLLKLEESRVE
ncbi:hypothetical protein ACRRTK_006831 [Alexandromys fortis]